MAIALLDPMVQNPCPEPPELEADRQDNPGVTLWSLSKSVILCTLVYSEFFEAICEVHWVCSCFHHIFLRQVTQKEKGMLTS
ncbi:hypothetical protein PVAP13_4KG122405 [Panicum virgatum]|uniref:Uncharacterized protein n=1 Tax=Panicum virgatum TaxID=38727 RepID=A0A8T0TRP2_PANVG|nr:hypothetical protein PVAP13_4KG122405 [Panicum virgatum]